MQQADLEVPEFLLLHQNNEVADMQLRNGGNNNRDIRQHRQRETVPEPQEPEENWN